ncbi:hypothetical protein EYC84_007637 [Monilinia fructicola]|uniref:Uncharacterized protein n=1 Tax=Monilinia fructicola TaxID=38448 RepID=A0A5M9JLK3_MONFR|nr:hypothetical protein EYC84_007637 [Monilinia fructicola]
MPRISDIQRIRIEVNEPTSTHSSIGNGVLGMGRWDSTGGSICIYAFLGALGESKSLGLGWSLSSLSCWRNPACVSGWAGWDMGTGMGRQSSVTSTSSDYPRDGYLCGFLLDDFSYLLLVSCPSPRPHEVYVCMFPQSRSAVCI